MLFSRQAEDGSVSHHACCLTAAGAAAVLPLPDVPAAFAGVRGCGSCRPRRLAGSGPAAQGRCRGGGGVFPAPAAGLTSGGNRQSM